MFVWGRGRKKSHQSLKVKQSERLKKKNHRMVEKEDKREHERIKENMR